MLRARIARQPTADHRNLNIRKTRLLKRLSFPTLSSVSLLFPGKLLTCAPLFRAKSRKVKMRVNSCGNNGILFLCVARLCFNEPSQGELFFVAKDKPTG